MMVAIRHHARTANTDRISRTAAGWKPHIISAELAAFFSRLRSAGSTQRRRRRNPQNSGAGPAQRLGTKQLLLTLYREISNDRVLAISAGVTFYALLAIFPAVAAFVSIYGLFADLKTINADLTSMSTVLPGGAISVGGDQIKRVAADKHRSLSFVASLGS